MYHRVSLKFSKNINKFLLNLLAFLYRKKINFVIPSSQIIQAQCIGRKTVSL